MRGTAITAAMCAHIRTVGEPRAFGRERSVAAVVSDGGHSRIVAIPLDTGASTTLTTEPGPRSARAMGGGVFDISADGTTLVFVSAGGGLWQAPSAGGQPSLIAGTADARHLASPTISPQGDRVAYVLDEHRVEIAELDGSSIPQAIPGRADFALDPTWSPDGAYIYWHQWDVPAMPWDLSSIARCEVATGRVDIVVQGEHAVAQPRLSPNGEHLGFVSDHSGWMTLWIARPDGSGAQQVIADQHEHAGPTWGPGQRSFSWSPSGARVALTRNENGFGVLVVVDIATRSAVTISRGTHGGLTWIDEVTLVAVRSGARTPTHLAAFDLSAVNPVRDGVVLRRQPTPAQPTTAQPTTAQPTPGAIELPVRKADRRSLMTTAATGFEPALAEPELVSWRASDGLEIPGRLFRSGPGPRPLIVWLHGGPTDQWQVTFRPRFCYFMNRGWSILVPDHRGSTGHGRAFAQALIGRWGEADVSDTVAGIEAAVASGWAHGDRIVVMGSSSGGATVLNVLGRHPGLCAAGINLFGVADFGATAAATHRFEAHYFDSIVGPPGDIARWRDRSPMAVADQISDPLLLLHGSDDDVVPVDQSRAIAAALAERQQAVELHVYRGEGHGWGRPEVVMDELERIDSFLAEHVTAPTPNE